MREGGHYSLFPVKYSEGLGRLWHIWHCQLQLYQVLYMGAKHRTYIIHDKFFIHNTHELFRVVNKNLVQRWTGQLFIYLGAVDEHPLKSSGRSSQKLTHPLLEQPSMQCEFGRDLQGSSLRVAFWQATMADTSWKGNFRVAATSQQPIYIIRGWNCKFANNEPVRG